MAENTNISLDDVARSVKELSDAVDGMKQGLVSEETVKRIAEEVAENQAALTPEQNRRRGYEPEDTPDEGTGLLRATGRQRMVEIHSRPAAEVARLTRKHKDDVQAFQQTADKLVLLSAVLDKDPRETRFFEEEYRPMLQAMDSTTAAEGDEFVPLALSADLIERVSLELRVLANLPAINMPTQPFDIPGRSATRQRLGKADEQTADSGQTKFKKVTPATRKVTLDAEKFAGEGLVSKELDEDGIIAILPFLEEELIDWLAADLEDTAINGDTAGTHQDTDVSASDDPRKNWEGLRQLTPSGAKKDQSAAAALTVAMLRDNRKNMGKYGVNPRDLFHLVSINGYIQLLADTNVMTVDKYGAQATILTGELGRADGVPLVVSEYVRTDLDATGVNSPTAGNNIKQMALTVHRRGFVRGLRRGVTVQVLRELYAESDQDAVIVTTRQAFSSRHAAAEKVVAYSYNITS
jgi:HK97 family phage major capsid protein